MTGTIKARDIAVTPNLLSINLSINGGMKYTNGNSPMYITRVLMCRLGGF